jgi:hypothetical protein
MDEKAAKALAKAIGGEEWQSGGGTYVVAIRRPDGALVVFSDDLVAEYADDEAFDAAKPTSSIMLRDDPTEYWVVEDAKGTVMLADLDHGRGWADEYDAQHEASGLQSRTGIRTWARRQELEDTIDATP